MLERSEGVKRECFILKVVTGCVTVKCVLLDAACGQIVSHSDVSEM